MNNRVYYDDGYDRYIKMDVPIYNYNYNPFSWATVVKLEMAWRQPTHRQNFELKYGDINDNN